MSAGAPWSVKGIDPKAREVAKDLARRSGMTLGEWLNRVILEDDLPEEVTAEAQLADRTIRLSQDAPRLVAVPESPDLTRIAYALDRITDRLEASETRTGLAINGVEHSVRHALARIETAEREQHAVSSRIEGLLTDATVEQGRFADRLRRLESEAIGPRSAEVLRAIEARQAAVEPDLLVETVLQRLGDRLARAEARTATALEALNGSLGSLDRRLGSVEHRSGDDVDLKFEALGRVLTHRVEAVRAEMASRLEAAAGPEVEARLAAMAETVREAERRSTRAVEEIGRQVLSMAEAVSRKLVDVDQRSADAIDLVGTEVARIAGAVEQRLARGEHAQAEAFERLGAELARVTETLGERLAAGERQTAQSFEAADADLDRLVQSFEPQTPQARDAPPSKIGMAPEPEPEPRLDAQPHARPAPPTSPGPLADLQTAALLEEARQRLGPPPEPEPELSIANGPFGAELFSRAEIDEDQPAVTLDAPWRRLDLEVPEGDIPEVFAPINESEDEELFAPSTPRPAAEPEQLSTREVIDRARAAAREAGAAKPVEMRAKVEKRAVTGRLFQGFGGAKAAARRQTSALQTALMVAGGAAFLSVGAAGLTLMQGAPPAPAQAENSPFGDAPRAAVALSNPTPSATPEPAPVVAPVYEQVRAEVETGVPGALARLKALADANHPQAQLYLGQLYDTGEAGVVRDPVEARRLVGLAAGAGDPNAMHNLGVYYFRGEGGAQDLPNAAFWFRKAAEAGIVESQYNLGLLYRTGSGVPKDLVQARQWFREASARGDADARRALAELEPRSQAQAQAQAQAPAARRPARPATAPAAVASQNVRQTQLILARLGYYDGPADGFSNPAYRTALTEYQRDQDSQRTGPRPYVASR